jgi:hypothetical protein
MVAIMLVWSLVLLNTPGKEFDDVSKDFGDPTEDLFAICY